MSIINEYKHGLTGPVTSVSTPFLKDGKIDFKGLRNCIDFWIAAGSRTMLLTNGDSLFSILTDSEIASITKVVAEQAKGRAMVVAAARWWTGKCIKFAQFCKEKGVNVLMVLPPDWAQSCTAESLSRYYKTISKEIPVMIVTSLNGRAIPLDVIKILLEGKNNIVAVKDDICSEYGRRAASLINGHWAFFSGGFKSNHLDVMPYGDISGYLSVYMRFKPEVAKMYWEAICKQDIVKAAEVIRTYEHPLRYEIMPQIDRDAVIHASMEIYGLCGRWKRAPYYNLNDEQMEILKDFYRSKRLL